MDQSIDEVEYVIVENGTADNKPEFFVQIGNSHLLQVPPEVAQGLIARGIEGELRGLESADDVDPITP